MIATVKRGVQHLSNRLDAKLAARSSLNYNLTVADIDIGTPASDFLWASE